jgi:hypothetical protein
MDDTTAPRGRGGSGERRTTLDLHLLDEAAHGLSEQAREITRRLTGVGVSAVGVAPAPLRHVLASLARSMDELPSISQQLDVLMSQVRAQRLAIQAVEAELAALDDQLPPDEQR